MTRPSAHLDLSSRWAKAQTGDGTGRNYRFAAVDHQVGRNTPLPGRRFQLAQVVPVPAYQNNFGHSIDQPGLPGFITANNKRRYSRVSHLGGQFTPGQFERLVATITRFIYAWTLFSLSGGKYRLIAIATSASQPWRSSTVLVTTTLNVRR